MADEVILPKNQPPVPGSIAQGTIPSSSNAPYQPLSPPPMPYQGIPDLRARSGGGGGVQIAIGAGLLILGIVLSVAGTGVIFTGLIAVGGINIVRGIIKASS